MITLSFGLLALITPPAEAVPSHCKTTRDAINSWDDPSDDDSVSTKELRELRRLIEAFASCKRSIPVLPEEPPTRAEPTTSAHTGMGKDAGQWRQLAAKYFKRGDLDRVVCLIGAESGGNPTARNKRTGAAGLMQVMPFWADAVGIDYQRLFEPKVNLWVARHIYELQGWNAWNPYRRGACRGL